MEVLLAKKNAFVRYKSAVMRCNRLYSKHDMVIGLEGYALETGHTVVLVLLSFEGRELCVNVHITL